jgi:PPOX class probable F420-dependent enzyme
MNAQSAFAGARVARLATAGEDGRPHLVPLVFAVVEDTIYSVVDAKPKRTTQLRRLANVAANPSVSVLVDHYDDDWRKLWWVRADGTARVVPLDSAEGRLALSALTSRYPQYATTVPPGPVLAIDVERWVSWSPGAADR